MLMSFTIDFIMEARSLESSLSSSEESEEDASAKGLARLVEDVLAGTRSTVICTHRPVLPDLCDALGVEPGSLELAEILVLHLRKKKIAGIERHPL